MPNFRPLASMVWEKEQVTAGHVVSGRIAKLCPSLRLGGLKLSLVLKKNTFQKKKISIILFIL